jgi:hypothetical protein
MQFFLLQSRSGSPRFPQLAWKVWDIPEGEFQLVFVTSTRLSFEASVPFCITSFRYGGLE